MTTPSTVSPQAPTPTLPTLLTREEAWVGAPTLDGPGLSNADLERSYSYHLVACDRLRTRPEVYMLVPYVLWTSERQVICFEADGCLRRGWTLDLSTKV
jgi:hypothetical protein